MHMVQIIICHKVRLNIYKTRTGRDVLTIHKQGMSCQSAGYKRGHVLSEPLSDFIRTFSARLADLTKAVVISSHC